jgi:hypothetical protein
MVRRALILPPLAMVASGCTPAEWMPSWTPSSTLEYATPKLVTVDLPARADALARWQLPPNNPWAPYAKYTLLSALDEKQDRATLPDVMSFDDVQRASLAGRRLGQSGLPTGTLWIVDMRGASSVAFGVGVSTSARGPVTLVPTFNNWPGGESEVVPAEETLAAMVGLAPLQPDGESTTQPFFLLDSWRLAYRDEAPADDAYDNRYMLSPTDLPDAETLLARGINQVVYVVESLGQASVEEEDLHDAFLAYQDAGLVVSMIDIDVLEEPLLPDRWGVVLRGCILHVRPRVTVIQQPWFYTHARGGFGGVLARPAVGGGVGHGGGG